MERHKCKLCSRRFPNGRALGGHMKAHLATLSPKPKPLFSPDDEHDAPAHRESPLVYGLRENPKKSLRVSDPEDGESETESRNPTRRRSKRTRKPKLSLLESPEQPVSSVSDTSPEEDVATCLMMLSRDTWRRSVDVSEEEEEWKEMTLRRIGGNHESEKCGKTFRSSRALDSHKSVCVVVMDEGAGADKMYECPFCDKVFGSGQALGGHKRSHITMPSSSSSTVKLKESFIDLNLPAPVEDDDLSVVSEA